MLPRQYVSVCRVFVEYLDQFPPATSKNRTVVFTLETCIDRYSNSHKKVECM